MLEHIILALGEYHVEETEHFVPSILSVAMDSHNHAGADSTDVQRATHQAELHNLAEALASLSPVRYLLTHARAGDISIPGARHTRK